MNIPQIEPYLKRKNSRSSFFKFLFLFLYGHNLMVFLFKLLNSTYRWFLLSSPSMMVQSLLWMIHPMVKSFSVPNWIWVSCKSSQFSFCDLCIFWVLVHCTYGQKTPLWRSLNIYLKLLFTAFFFPTFLIHPCRCNLSAFIFLPIS